MYFAEIENPFGTSVTTAPTAGSIKVRPHLRPKTKPSAVKRFIRNPIAPSTIIKHALLTW